MWEDYLLFAGNLGLSAAMLPTIIRWRLPSRWTCLPMALIDGAFLVAYIALGLSFAAVGGAVSTGLWAWLAWRSQW